MVGFVCLEQEVGAAKGSIFCQKLSRNALLELQTVLSSAGYYRGIVDGIYGINTASAIALFKQHSYLNRPTEIGVSTIEALKKLGVKAAAVEVDQAVVVVNPQAGKHGGKSVVLPGGTRVSVNEFILPGVPLTWGEMTKDLTRIPVNVEVVKNIVTVAKGFGKLRVAIGTPLRINSGYRPPELRIGASASQHKLGNAIDVCPLDGNLNRLWLVGAKSDAVGLGKGMHLGFVHFDWRKTGEKRVVFSY
jgi:peptidoglycan hydrolase-like protein with peptidoglycan-binding domain